MVKILLIAYPSDHFRVDSMWEKISFKFAITSRFDQNFSTVAIISRYLQIPLQLGNTVET